MAQDEEFAGANYAPIEETGEVHQEWLRQGGAIQAVLGISPTELA